MENNFTNKIIWITGACSGIGRALSLALNKEGAIVIISSPFLAGLEDVKAQASFPEKIHIEVVDLVNEESIHKAFVSVSTKFSTIDILINNAGISQRSLVAETPLSVDRKIMEVNYFGSVSLTKYVLPLMLSAGKGYILCTTSMVGKFGFPLRSAYSAAKHAQIGFFESLRTEYYKQGIDVSIIIGGRIQTNISLHALTKDGESYGKMDEGQKNGISAEKAAAIILRGMQKKKAEILIGGSELLMLPIKRFFPKLHFYITQKIKHT